MFSCLSVYFFQGKRWKKWNDKFLRNNAASNMKNFRFCTQFFVEKYGWEPDLDPKPKLYSSQSRIWRRIRNLIQVGAGAGTTLSTIYSGRMVPIYFTKNIYFNASISLDLPIVTTGTHWPHLFRFPLTTMSLWREALFFSSSVSPAQDSASIASLVVLAVSTSLQGCGSYRIHYVEIHIQHFHSTLDADPVPLSEMETQNAVFWIETNGIVFDFCSVINNFMVL
jgi:hypothetical protein